MGVGSVCFLLALSAPPPRPIFFLPASSPDWCSTARCGQLLTCPCACGQCGVAGVRRGCTAGSGPWRPHAYTSAPVHAPNPLHPERGSEGRPLLVHATCVLTDVGIVGVNCNPRRGDLGLAQAVLLAWSSVHGASSHGLLPPVRGCGQAAWGLEGPGVGPSSALLCTSHKHHSSSPFPGAPVVQPWWAALWGCQLPPR